MSNLDSNTVALTTECVAGSNRLDISWQRNIWIGYASTILVLAILFGGVYYLQIESWMTSTVLNTRAITKTDRVKLIDAMNHAVADTRFLSRASSMPLGRSELTESERSKIAQDFIALGNSSGQCHQIRLIGIDGDEVVRVNFKAGRGEIVKQSELQNKFDRYYVSEGLKLSPSQVYISPLDLNVENSAIEKPYKPVVRLVTAVPAVDIDFPIVEA